MPCEDNGTSWRSPHGGAVCTPGIEEVLIVGQRVYEQRENLRQQVDTRAPHDRGAASRRGRGGAQGCCVVPASPLPLDTTALSASSLPYLRFIIILTRYALPLNRYFLSASDVHLIPALFGRGADPLCLISLVPCRMEGMQKWDASTGTGESIPAAPTPAVMILSPPPVDLSPISTGPDVDRARSHSVHNPLIHPGRRDIRYLQIGRDDWQTELGRIQAQR